MRWPRRRAIRTEEQGLVAEGALAAPLVLETARAGPRLRRGGVGLRRLARAPGGAGTLGDSAEPRRRELRRVM
jgi:hypothetical protein